jgi:hypothetical protein
MSDPAIIEAARRALYDTDGWDQDDERKVHTIVAAVTPLIRASALEEAIRVTEKHFVGIFTGWVGHAPVTLEEAETVAAECSLLCAADIRRLKGKP